MHRAQTTDLTTHESRADVQTWFYKKDWGHSNHMLGQSSEYDFVNVCTIGTIVANLNFGITYMKNCDCMHAKIKEKNKI